MGDRRRAAAAQILRRAALALRSYRRRRVPRVSDSITVLLKRLPGTGDIPLPVRMTAEAAGVDLRAAVTEPAILQPGDILLVPCGFAMAVPKGFEAQVRPRSGLAA